MIFTSNDHALRANGQSFKFAIKLRNLVTIEKLEHRNSYLSQKHISLVEQEFAVTRSNKNFFKAIKIYFSFFFFHLLNDPIANF